MKSESQAELEVGVFLVFDFSLPSSPPLARQDSASINCCANHAVCRLPWRTSKMPQAPFEDGGHVWGPIPFQQPTTTKLPKAPGDHVSHLIMIFNLESKVSS